MSLDPIAPYPVSLYDPPLVDDTPEYGDEDAPVADGLCFSDYLLSVAVEFRKQGTQAGDYIAGILAAKARLSADHRVSTPSEMVTLEAQIAQRQNSVTYLLSRRV